MKWTEESDSLWNPQTGFYYRDAARGGLKSGRASRREPLTAEEIARYQSRQAIWDALPPAKKAAWKKLPMAQMWAAQQMTDAEFLAFMDTI